MTLTNRATKDGEILEQLGVTEITISRMSVRAEWDPEAESMACKIALKAYVDPEIVADLMRMQKDQPLRARFSSRQLPLRL